MTPPFVPQLTHDADHPYFDHYDETEPWEYEPASQAQKKDFHFVGYTYKIEEEKPKDFIKDELNKVERQKEKEKQEHAMAAAGMKKKQKLGICTGTSEPSYAKQVLQQLSSGQQTARSEQKGRKSKSPLATKDNNRLKTKPSHSKSPIRV